MYLTDFTPATSGLTYSGWAQTLNPSGGQGNPLRLTNGLASDAGLVTASPSAHPSDFLAVGQAYTTSSIALPPDFSFSTYFAFHVLNNVGVADDATIGPIGPGADGLVFVIQAQGNQPWATSGDYSLAFQGMPTSIAVEFDTYYNSGVDPNGDGNHIGLDQTASISSVATYSPPELINDGFPNYVWIDYNGTIPLFEVRYSRNNTRPATAVLSSTTFTLANLGASNYAHLYAGFGSAVGGAGGTHEILEWRFRSGYSPIIVACPSGMFLNGTACATVPPGYFNSVSSSYCISSCTAGTFSTGGAANCTSCPANTFSTGTSVSCQSESFSFDIGKTTPDYLIIIF